MNKPIVVKRLAIDETLPVETIAAELTRRMNEPDSPWELVVTPAGRTSEGRPVFRVKDFPNQGTEFIFADGSDVPSEQL